MDILSRSLFKGHLSLKPKRIFSNTVRESLNTNIFYHEISPRKTFSEIYLIERIVSLFLERRIHQIDWDIGDVSKFRQCSEFE